MVKQWVPVSTCCAAVCTSDMILLSVGMQSSQDGQSEDTVALSRVFALPALVGPGLEASDDSLNNMPGYRPRHW